MGIFDDIKAIKDVQKLKSGGHANLSISQIVNLIINLPDARKNLSVDQYNEVEKLYKKLRGCKTKLNLDLQGYYATAIDIIVKFDDIAAYEKYSGGNENEFTFLMDEIRSARTRAQESEDQEFIETVTQSAFFMTEDDVKNFIRVSNLYQKAGRDAAWKELCIVADSIQEKDNPDIFEMVIAQIIILLSQDGIYRNNKPMFSREEADGIALHLLKEVDKERKGETQASDG